MIKAGATTLNIPDTVGWSMPHEYQALVAGIKANTPGIENVVLSTHCHDDLGLAAANSLAGVMAGIVSRFWAGYGAPELHVIVRFEQQLYTMGNRCPYLLQLMQCTARC